MAQRSQSFAYGTKSATATATTTRTTTTVKQKSNIYSALLSKIAIELRQRITLADHIKDDIEYKNTFDGKQAVDKIASIVQTSDRKLALRIGRMLSEQRFFHDVSYETQLVDSSIYLYEFTNRTLYSLNTQHQQSGSDWSGSESLSEHNVDVTNNNQIIPNGIIVDLTYCYVPTCWDLKPCYSPICPKRFTQSFSNLLVSLSSSKSTLVKSKSALHHDYWADGVEKSIYDSLSKTERKRQENLYELIYTEKDYVQSLEYLQNMWIKPLTERPIIPASRKETLLRKVFGGIEEIYKINIRLLRALQERQSQHSIIHQVGDILLDFVVEFEPYIYYGSKQYEAKFALENERFINPNFDAFVEATERHPDSLKLELNGYLTKPTTRLGRYTLLFNEILKHTPADHPDLQDLPKAVTIIKRFLSRVNAETGKAKNRFDLERIHYNLSFKYKADEVNLDLLAKNRSIVKQGALKKSAQLESVEYQVILFDHYLVIAKLKIVNGTERYVIQKRASITCPIPIELLSVYLPDANLASKRSSTLVLPYLTMNTPNPMMAVPGAQVRASTDIGPYLQQQQNTSSGGSPTNGSSSSSNNNNSKLNQYPIAFQHLGRSTSAPYILFAPSHATRKPWFEKIRSQQEAKNKRSPIFEMVSSVLEHQFIVLNKIHHFITFNGGQQYLLAADDGVYVGHHNYRHAETTPHKVLSLDKVTQIQTIESTETLLVLADRTLWEYPLDIVNGKPETQPRGRLVQTHVPFFYVGTCLKRIMVCVPKIATLRSVITVFEAIKRTDILNNNSNMGDRLMSMRALSQPADDLHLRKVKDTYVPSEAYAVELSASMMLITSSRGMIMVDMRTDQPQQLLNPGDRNLAFIMEREKEVSSSLNLRQPVKRIAIFRTPRNHYFICYDEYAFYIDSKGNRLFTKFLIEWEGTPESFAFCYPYVMAFDASFIEIRNVITGAIEQIIRGKQMKCLNNGHKTELPLIFGSMADPVKDNYQFVFKLQLAAEHSIEEDITSIEPSTLHR
ncbi:hypothetical protein HMPREF1544_09124 [Mucor circinelloides 1006PhL]|uniref:DH domain-containing protein n=1 Tax=Mucor circinelloides f. circinelloides (strain 1006PhL) TaxID=1220926 RepID=S2J245_MUCC1|nr:hypothetical protein HMPREF1544_09124 [Mucor circinelloides 1006PhL]